MKRPDQGRVRPKAARPWVVAAAALTVVSAVLFLAPPAQSTPRAATSPINGGGSGFAALEIDQWRADTARKPYSLKVNYVSQGSTFGRQQFIDGNLDFGVSDIVFLDSELPQLKSKRCGGKDPASCFVYVPVSAGGLAFMYNLLDNAGKRVSDLKLTRRTACKVFTGAITKWNDPEIVATNPRLTTFARDIVPVIRGDGAGESYVLSQFCQAVAPDVWKAFIADRQKEDPSNVAPDFKAGKPVSNWPQGWGRANPALYADGVANTVADPVTGKNAITYTAAGYAKVRSFPVASVQNGANVYTQPDEANVTVALGYAKGRGDGTFVLNFSGADPRAYFPSTYSYVIAQTNGFNPAKGATLGQYLCYAVSKGQEIAPSLRYARLSSVLVGIAIDAITKIPGAPSKSACSVAGSSAPPPPPTVVPGNGNGNGNGTPGGGTPGGSTPGGTGGTGQGGGTSGTGSATGGTGSGTDGGTGTGTGSGSGSAQGGAEDPLAPMGDAAVAGGSGGAVAATTGNGTQDYSGSAWLVAIGAVLCMVGGGIASRLRRPA
ncbi:MAG: substrate-binding domain-containing protein [Acidimicrobiales bacterium]